MCSINNMNQGWYSEKAVLKDLAKATGIKHFDKSAFVIGERPPLSRVDNEIDPTEMFLRCGSLVPETAIETTGPDLNGITEMLRMIETHNDANEVSPTDNVNENPVENVLTIIKLNPNLKKFLPIGSKNTASSDKENDIPRSDSNVKENGNAPLKYDNDKQHVSCLVQVMEHNNDVAKKKEIKEKLKTKISSTSNATSMKVKHERNLAIMSLMKLYSQPPVIETSAVKHNSLPTSDSQKQSSVTHDRPSVKLLPPNYYETSLNTLKDNVYDKAENYAESINTNKNEKLTENWQNNTNSMTENVTVAASTKNKAKQVVKATGENKSNLSCVSKILDVDVDVQVSVDKVTKWLESNDIKETKQQKKSLEGLTKVHKKSHDSSCSSKNTSPLKITNNISPKKEVRKINKSGTESPSLYLGPVTFKRKGVPASNSPSLSSSDLTTKKPSSSMYIPSAYANELSKTYMDRANAKRELENDIWSKLKKN